MKVDKYKYITIAFFIIIGFLGVIKLNLNIDILSTNLFNATESKKNINMITKTKDLSEFDNIDIDVNISDIQIIPSDKYKIEVKYREDENEVVYEVINNTLQIKQVKNKNEFKLGISTPKKYSRGSIKIYIPKDTNIDSLIINSYISNISISQFKINNLELDYQVGEVDLSNIHVYDKLKVEDEIGNMSIEESEIQKLNLIIGSGDLSIRECNINESELYSDTGDIKLDNIRFNKKLIIVCKLGNIDIIGHLFGNTKISSENGDIKVKISESKKDYNYSIECNLGIFKLDGKEYDKGIIVNNNQNNHIDITCDIGSVRLDFKN